MIESYKWGGAPLGSAGGTVTWSATYSGLNFDSGLYNQGDFSQALQDAFDAWESVAQIDFQFSSSSPADIQVSMASLSGSTVGSALISYYKEGAIDRIASGEIQFDSDETWDPYGATDLSFYAVALHEIGHVIGLGHVNDPTEIMNPVVSANALGDGDILGAQTIYGASGSTPTPPSTPASGGGGGGDGGGGFMALILGLLGLLFGFGGGGAMLAIAAAHKADEDDDDASQDWGDTLLSDLVPSTGALDETLHTHSHDVYADDGDDLFAAL